MMGVISVPTGSVFKLVVGSKVQGRVEVYTNVLKMRQKFCQVHSGEDPS